MAEQSTKNKAGVMGTVQHAISIVLKWKWTALSVAAVIIVLMTAFTLLRTPVYTAVGRVWIENDPNIMGFENILSYDAGSYLESHSKLFRSRALAAEVIEDLKLHENPHFVGEPRKGQKAPDIKDPIYRETLVGGFIGRITVTPVLRTRIVEVEFEDSDPKFASDTLNALFDRYLDMIARQKYTSLEEASRFLNEQIGAVRTELTESEKRLNAMGSEQDILPLTAAETPTVTRVSDLSRELMLASVDRVKKHSEYLQLKSGTLEDIPSTRISPLVESMRQQFATLSQDYARKLADLGPQYPEMVRMKSQMDSISAGLQKERDNIIAVAFSDYQAAAAKEQSLQRLLDQEKSQAFKAQSGSIVYNTLKAEIENKKILLNELITRQGEMETSSRLKSVKPSNVWIVDRASLPLQPTSPKRGRDTLLGLVFGIFAGCGLAFLIEYLNQSVRTSRDIALHTGLPTLGFIPAFESEAQSRTPRAELGRLADLFLSRDGTKAYAPHKVRKLALPGRRPKDKAKAGPAAPPAPKAPAGPEAPAGPKAQPDEAIELIVSKSPHSIQSEHFRSIRTTMLISAPPGRIKSVLFTSALAREGKSATVSNLAITLAQASKRVIVVDSDLRRPKQHEIFEMENQKGLSTFLSSSVSYTTVVRPTSFVNVSVVTSGPPAANPIELLNSDRMDDLVAVLKQHYDYILLDAPPLLAVSDAIALGPVVDAIVLVARGGRTPINALKQAKQKLDSHKLKSLGVILNGVNIIEQDGYYAKQYYKYYH